MIDSLLDIFNDEPPKKASAKTKPDARAIDTAGVLLAMPEFLSLLDETPSQLELARVLLQINNRYLNEQPGGSPLGPEEFLDLFLSAGYGTNAMGTKSQNANNNT